MKKLRKLRGSDWSTRQSPWIVAMGLLVLMVVAPFGEAQAQDPGDLRQWNWNSEDQDETPGEGHVTTIFDQQPLAGNLLIAIAGHRIDWVDAVMHSEGWEMAVQRNDAELNQERRRGVAMWYKIAGDDEPSEVVAEWSNPAIDESHTGRHATMIIKEIYGNFSFLDVTATASSLEDRVHEISTGTTAQSVGAQKVAIGVGLSRGVAGEGTWTNGFDANKIYVNSDALDAPHPTSIQTSRLYSTNQQQWESTVSWTGGEGAAFGLMAVFSSGAAGDYIFSSQCSPTMTYDDLDDPDQANILIMLDQSGSMGDQTDDAGNLLWDVAYGAVDQSVAAMEDELRFGLGLFPGPMDDECFWLETECVDETLAGDDDEDTFTCYIELCAPPGGFTCDDVFGDLCLEGPGEGHCIEDAVVWEGLCPANWLRGERATEELVSEPMAHQAIMDILNDTGPGGGTPTWSAMETLNASESLNDPAHPGAGVLITDGQPYGRDDARLATIEATCEAREAGKRNFIVGLGGATDQNFNNLQAAAAGTGYCCDAVGANCEFDESAQLDPCEVADPITDIEWEEGVCSGAFQTNNQTELRNAMLSISSQMACTFDVNDDFWFDGVPDDPGVGRIVVRDDETGEDVMVPHISFVGNIGSYEACPDTDEYCVQGGLCKDTDENFACGADSHCDDPDLFCHQFLGCEDKDDYCNSDADCSTGFCWFNKCVEQEVGPSDERCASHADCVDWGGSGNDYACHEGLCRYTPDEWCPHDDYLAGSWLCEDFEDDYCHPIDGCTDRANYECLVDDDCDITESCWLGKCVPDEDRCDAGADGGWYFANEERNRVTLTGEFCSGLGSVDGGAKYTRVVTRLACNCYSRWGEFNEDTGDWQGYPCPCAGGNINDPPYTNPGNACPGGRYSCPDQMAYVTAAEADCENCGSTNEFFEDCPFHCSPDDAIHNLPCDQDCEVIWEWYNPDDQSITIVCDGVEIDPLDLEPTSDGQLVRCLSRLDRVTCTGNAPPSCEVGEIESLRPMPELCDGLDSSCDGRIDNIAESWDNWRNCEGTWHPDNWEEEDWGPNPCGSGAFEIYDYLSAGGVAEGAACYEITQECSCAMPDFIHSPAGVTYEDEFIRYLQAWEARDGCGCITQ